MVQRRRMPSCSVLAAGVLAPLLARAEIIPPDAGQLLERSREGPVVVPMAPPRIELPAAPAPAAPAGVLIPVQRLRITGATVFPESELQALVQDAAGRRLAFAELQELAARITRHYVAHGYLLARAFLPPQEIRDGEVVIAVQEGRLERVVAEDAAELPARLRHGLNAALPPGQPLRQADLERTVLLYDTLPGIAAQARLRAGELPGGTVVVLATQPEVAPRGEVTLDNHGDRYTGELQAGLRLERNHLVGGDQLALRAFSTGEGRVYGRLAYDFPVAGAWRGTLAASSTRYELGEEFRNLEADGRAHTISAEARYPLVLRPTLRVNAVLGADHIRLVDRIGLFASTRDKDVNDARAGLALQAGDAWRGQSAFSLQLTAGHVDIHDPAEQRVDAATVGSEGGFGKLNLAGERWQVLTPALQLRLGISLQHAFANLASAQKLPIGGASGVRAYPAGEAQGDAARLATLELHRRVALAAPGQFTATAFADYGYARFNHALWPGFAGTPKRELAGAGLGLDWRLRRLGLTAWQAWPLTDTPATAEPDRGSRFWISLRLGF